MLKSTTSSWCSVIADRCAHYQPILEFHRAERLVRRAAQGTRGVVRRAGTSRTQRRSLWLFGARRYRLPQQLTVTRFNGAVMHKCLPAIPPVCCWYGGSLLFPLNEEQLCV